ncbi:MAG: class I SAM-dependent methyltransferase [Elusimicrobia bacterium]|nr:class I SAM-dependent methyltransferase [Elusimicrobiota bacterium]
MQNKKSGQTDISGYEALKIFAVSHNYNKWIYELLAEYIAGRTVLEVGCGIGNLSRYFLKSCAKLIGIDTSELFIRHLKIDHPEMELYNFDVTDDKIMSLADKKVDTVVAVNVLEHVKDDEKALKNMCGLLEPGGHLLLFVPALSRLFGTLDQNVSHYRRYEKKDLRAKVERGGFAVEKIFFSNFAGIFGWFLNGKILRRKHFPIMQPLIFDKFVPLIARIEGWRRPPIGMNLIVIARKI